MPNDMRKFWLGVAGSIITTIILSGGAAYLGTERALSDYSARIKSLESWQSDVKMWQQDKEAKWMQYAEAKGEITIRLKVIEANQINIERKIDDIFRLAKKN